MGREGAEEQEEEKGKRKQRKGMEEYKDHRPSDSPEQGHKKFWDWNTKHRTSMSLLPGIHLYPRFKLGIFTELLNVWASVSLILMPCLGALFFLLSCLVQPWADGLFTLFCHVWLLHLEVCSFLIIQRKNESRG